MARSLCGIALVSLGALGACSSDKSSPGSPGNGAGGSTSGTPTIAITNPADGASVGPGAAFPDYPDIPVEFTVTGFTLKAPGTCAGATGCGHVHLLVDGTACNDTGSPYNNAGASSPINAGLDYCKKIDGEHTVTLELHNDDHTGVKVDGKIVSDSRKIVAAPLAGGDAAAP